MIRVAPKLISEDVPRSFGSMPLLNGDLISDIKGIKDDGVRAVKLRCKKSVMPLNSVRVSIRTDSREMFVREEMDVNIHPFGGRCLKMS